MANFEIDGLKELVAAFEKLGPDALKQIKPDVKKAGNILLDAIKQEVPVRTGKLKNSLHAKEPRKSNETISTTITWGDDVRDYAAPVELGHRLVYFGKKTWKSVAAKPFLRPGADKSKEKVFKTIGDGLSRTIDNMGGKK
jgi:HK97 gp10 family phage protein